MAFMSKKRSPYDKIVKQAIELLRHELAPLHQVAATQKTIMDQNEKNSELLRQIADKLDQRAESSAARLESPG